MCSNVSTYSLYTQLKVYAEVQTNLTTWRIENAGYVINGRVFSSKPTEWDNSNLLHRGLFVSTVFGIIFAIIFFIVLTHVIFTRAPDYNSQNFMLWHNFIWVSVGALAQVNVAFLIVDFVQSGIWGSSPAGRSEAIFFKMAGFTMVLVLSMAAIFFFNIYIPKMRINELTRHLLEVDTWNVLVFFPLNMIPCLHVCPDLFQMQIVKTGVSTFFNILFFPTLLTSLSLVFCYLFPVLVLFVLHPIEVAALYSFLTATVILYILVVFYRECKRMLLRDNNVFKYYPGTLLYIVFIILVVVFGFPVVFVTILSGYPDNSVLRVILSQLPTLILLSIIYLVLKRIVSAKKRLQESAADSEGDGQPSEQNASRESSNVSAVPARVEPLASRGQGQSSQQSNYGATDEMRECIS